MREGLVRLRHLVCLFALLHRGASPGRRVDDFSGELLPHRLFTALVRVLDEPAHAERRPALRADFDRNLERRTTDAPRLHFDPRFDVLERLLEHRERVLAAAFLRDDRERAVADALRGRLLAALHQRVDELRDQAIVVLRIREYLPLGSFFSTAHYFALFTPYFDRPLLRFSLFVFDGPSAAAESS